MRKIFINENLVKIAEVYSINPFSKRRSDFISPKEKLKNLSAELRGIYPRNSDYIDAIISEYEILNRLLPSEIAAKKARFDSLVPEDDLSIEIPEKSKKLYELIVDAMRYEDLREKDFLPFLKKIGIKSCVYCNSQLTVVAEKDANNELSAKLELDHHYAKSKYPFLCTSFFNLYPSCGCCNRAKWQNDAVFELYSETEKDLDVFKFSIEDSSMVASYLNNRQIEDINFKFGAMIGVADISREHDKMFCIQGIYETQKDIIEELIHKKEVYTELYKKDLVDQYEKLFPDKSLINRLLIGNYDKPEEIHKRPMSKFMQDIWEDLNKI